MSERLTVVFEVADVAAEERLVREYVAPAFRRLERRDDARWPIFNRYGHDPSTERGELHLLVFGDAAAVADAERPRWDDLVADGPVLDWRADVADVPPADLSDLARFRYRMRAAASRMSLAFYERFDDLPDATDEFEDADHQIGWSLCLHHLVNQLGYQANDGEEEIDLLFEVLQSRLYATAVGPEDGADAATAKIDDLTAELDAIADELREMKGGE